ncbi:hypothetical protein UFOVP528_2 [uncultured Caudovirales phage]|uniref:Uncharacterized protein n=1 Tax=uncultured Caudovirales phage TaxID=2100421 RepID=A0A6J5MMV8_9CAUD|nr:hypothetical protein UFOVP528_2 [uncultured Caudovirales phage]
MLLITKGETKNWYLTLTEKVTIANPKFLFSFKNRVTEFETNVLLTDISAYIDRYNKFAVTEGTTFDLDCGEYNYFVYAQTSTTNTNPLLADELVEEGLFKLLLGTITTTEYEVDLTEKIYEIDAPTQIAYLLLENGGFLVQENGDKIIL